MREGAKGWLFVLQSLLALCPSLLAVIATAKQRATVLHRLPQMMRSTALALDAGLWAPVLDQRWHRRAAVSSDRVGVNARRRSAVETTWHQLAQRFLSLIGHSMSPHLEQMSIVLLPKH